MPKSSPWRATTGRSSSCCATSRTRKRWKRREAKREPSSAPCDRRSAPRRYERRRGKRPCRSPRLPMSSKSSRRESDPRRGWIEPIEGFPPDRGYPSVNRIQGTAVILLVACIGFLCPQPAGASFKMGVEGSSAKKLHLALNQSFLLDTSLKIKRVSVGKPEIADVTVVTPKQLLVTAKSPGTTTLIYWSEQGLPTSMDVNVEKESGVQADLQRIAPGEKFHISGPPDAMILSGKVSTDTAQQRIVDAAKAYSKNVVNLLAAERAEQIMLQVRVAEVDRTAARELGFGAQTEQGSIRGSLSPGNAFSPFFGNLRDQQIGNVGPNFSFSDALNLFVAKPGAFPKFAALIHALHDKGALRTLAEPNMVVANGGEGKFLAGGEFPVVYSTAGAAGNAVSVSYKEFGVRLNFKPKITPNGEISLKIAQ